MENQKLWRRIMDNIPSQLVEIEQKPSFGWRLKILMLSWEYPPNVVGGLSRHVDGLSSQLAVMGHEVHVLTAGNGELPSYELINGVNVHRVKPLNEQDNDFLSWIAGLNLAFAFHAEKLAKEIKFDLIHAHDWLVGSAAIALKEIINLPLLTTIHATEHGRNNGIHNEMQQFIHDKEMQLIAESDQIIVCSKYMKEVLISILQAKDQSLTVISNGIDPLQKDLDHCEVFPQLKGKKYIFSIGRMVEEKGFDTIIDAAFITKEKGLNFFFVVAGKGPMLEIYRRQIVEKNLENYIAFVGYITDQQRNSLINGSEMAVFPSLYEPFGIVALESMILGKPTIVSNIGGLKGIINHLQTGLLMVPGNADSMLKQVEYLINNPQTAKEIGNKGRQIVKSMYGWKRVASETSRVMEDLLLNMRVSRSEKEKKVN
jgi:glycogen synthase